MGQKNLVRVRQTIGTTLSVFALTAVLLTVGMIAFRDPLLNLLQTPKESFDLTAQYVTICSLGNIFICGYNAISALLRGYGDSTRPMIFVGIACFLNIVLDIVFVKYELPILILRIQFHKSYAHPHFLFALIANNATKKQ